MASEGDSKAQSPVQDASTLPEAAGHESGHGSGCKCVHRAHRNHLSEMLRKIPSDALWDVLDNVILPELMGHPSEVIEGIVDAVEEEFDVFLSNPSPPDLNPTTMKREFTALFDVLQHLSEDATTNRETDWDEWRVTLEQVADSFKHWLQNIWLSVWEYGCHFEKAQECLMIALNHYDKLMVPKMGCICPFMTLPLCITFKDLSGDIVKEWDTLSGATIHNVIFWTWRELFMQIISKDRPGSTQLISDMISEIEQTYGGCHHIVLCGGDPDGIGVNGNYHDDMNSEDDVSDDEYLEDDSFEMFYASHWEDLYDVYEELKEIFIERMKAYFDSHPTLHGYRTLCSLDSCHQELQERLLKISPYSRAAALCSLAVFRHIHSFASVRNTLENSSHLFEAQDGEALCSAASFLIKNAESKVFALEFIEKQLSDCLENARASIFSTFKLAEVETAIEELPTLTTFTLKSPKRIEKVQAWVKNILVPKSPLTDPFSMAAMIFGINAPEDDSEEEEEENEEQIFLDRDYNLQFDGFLEYGSVTQGRPKPSDLCNINRKYLVKRLSGWLELVGSLPHDLRASKHKILAKFEELVYQRLPWMKYSDIIAEFKTQYSRRQDERHLRAFLISLEKFLSERRAHRKRVHEARLKKAKKALEEAAKKPQALLVDEID